jgi:hypothetical protein
MESKTQNRFDIYSLPDDVLMEYMDRFERSRATKSKLFPWYGLPPEIQERIMDMAGCRYINGDPNESYDPTEHALYYQLGQTPTWLGGWKKGFTKYNCSGAYRQCEDCGKYVDDWRILCNFCYHYGKICPRCEKVIGPNGNHGLCMAVVREKPYLLNYVKLRELSTGVKLREDISGYMSSESCESYENS